MKKIIFLSILIILIFLIMFVKANSLSSTNIIIGLNKDQIGVTFIDDRKLLIHLNDDKYKLEINDSSYKITDVNNREVISFNSNLDIYSDDNKIIIRYQGNNLCILDNNSFDNCQYIYLIGNKDIGEIPSKIDLVIYGLNVNETTILNNYNNWIDTHELKKDYYTTLIWDVNQYQLLRIPKKEYQVLN